MAPVATSADGKSRGKLCSLAIDLNASKQIAPQAAASAGVPCRKIIFIASPFGASIGTSYQNTADRTRPSVGSCPRRSIGGLSRSDRRLERKPPMLAREEKERVPGVGRGTPMGDVLRRYWIPALMSREVPEADCPPVRVKLLGEKLVAFRDTQGRIGLVDEFCPHRRAS